MEEIKIPRSRFVLILGFAGGFAAILIGVVIFNAADGPAITSQFAVQAIAIFVGLAGIAAILLVAGELINPTFLVINRDGIRSKRSFGFVPWREIIAMQFYEQVEGGSSRNSVNVKGLLIKVTDPDKVCDSLTGLKKMGAVRSQRLRGSPVFIYNSDWNWSQDDIADKIQMYMNRYGT